MKKFVDAPFLPTEVEIEQITETSAKISAFPFESGYAITLAHPLRRLLISSSVGYSPIAVKIEGAKQVFTSKVGGGMIELSINGNSEVTDLQIDDSLLEDKDALKILLISAMNDVIKQSDEAKKTMAMNMMGGINPFAK